MRRFAGLSIVTLGLFLASGLSSAYAGIQDFVVRNFSNAAIFYVYVSPDYADTWEEDVLGADVLMPGQELNIRMNGYGSHCFFDIKVEDEYGGYYEYWDVDLCSVLYVDYE